MRVEDIMTRNVKFCAPDTNLAAAAEILWTSNCGTLPVVDSGSKLIGVLTDRDICIALGTRNCRASEITARDVAVKPVFSCGSGDDVHDALRTMRQHQIRRVPVVDKAGNLTGLVSLDDVALHAEKGDSKKTGITYEDVVTTMKGICRRHPAEVPAVSAMAAGAPIGL